MPRVREDRLTPEECEALIAEHPSVRRAARAIGVPYSTLVNWRWPERNQANAARYRAQDPERHRAKCREQYDRLDGVAYNARLLRHRRYKALVRRAEREQRRQEA